MTDRGDPIVLLVEVRALYLATHSLADTLETVEALAIHFTSAPILEAQIERLDLCAGATDLDFYRDDLDNSCLPH